MKKIIFLMLSAVVLCSSFVLATNSQESTSVNYESSIVKCEFTLNHYQGRLSDEDDRSNVVYTDDVYVKLNCAQKEKISVNVHVWVNGERVTSEIFEFWAGYQQSETKKIYLPKRYAGMRYKLTVN